MDPLRLGVRSVIGITMPGAIVVLSILFGIKVVFSDFPILHREG